MIGLTIERLNGTKMTNEDIGFTVDKIEVSMPTMTHNFEQIEGRHGNIDFGSTLDPRDVFVRGYFQSFNKESFPLYRDRIAKFFTSTEPFYLIDSRQPYKRWLVKLSGDWTADREPFHNVGVVEANFITIGQPYATSVFTSLEPRRWAENAWWWGAGISWSDENFVYRTNNFSVPNWGDVAVNPRFMDLIIRFSGQSENLRIENFRTGEVWQYFGTTDESDILVISGIRSLKNNFGIVRDTNRRLITLAPGDNEFQVSGNIGDFTISFEFRFPYL